MIMRCPPAAALAAALLAAAPARAQPEPAGAPAPPPPATPPAGTSSPAPAAPPAGASVPWTPPPDPAAVDAGEANLESIAARKGVMFTFAVGGAFSFGLGMSNATGQGAASTARLAHVANSRTVASIEIVNSTLFFPVSGKLYQTNATNLLVSGQYYVNPALWLRAGVGFGRYFGEELRMGDAIFRKRFRLAGPAGSAGAGIDVLRLKRVRASLEVCSTALLNREGILSSNGLLLGLTID